VGGLSDPPLMLIEFNNHFNLPCLAAIGRSLSINPPPSSSCSIDALFFILPSLTSLSIISTKRDSGFGLLIEYTGSCANDVTVSSGRPSSGSLNEVQSLDYIVIEVSSFDNSRLGFLIS
jgi:hypothetical protein